MTSMTNLASFLKSEIARVARKEIRAQVTPLKKSVASHRAEIAALKRDLKDAHQRLRQFGKTIPKADAAPKEVAGAPKRFKYTAEGLTAQRERLELTAEECGLLVGSTGQSIYKWEAKRAVPRPRYLPAIAALRSLSKKTVAARLAEIRVSM